MVDKLLYICFQADLLLSYGYEDDIKAFAAHVPRSCQCLLMSATSRLLSTLPSQAVFFSACRLMCSWRLSVARLCFNLMAVCPFIYSFTYLFLHMLLYP